MFRSKRKIYLDNAAATGMDEDVFKLVKEKEKKYFANPSALYKSAVDAKKDLENSRLQVAQILGSQVDTILFTHGGTQSCNMAVLGMFSPTDTKKHIITTQIEHHAVLSPIKELEKQGHEVTYLPVDENGIVHIDDVKKALKENTVFVSIMYANNEIGSIQPIAEIGREILKWRKKHSTLFPYFHSDACQVAGELDIKVEHLHVDLLSLNGSKLYGPKSVGILYKRRKIPLHPRTFGGGQEFGYNPGTEDVAKAAGIAYALTLAYKKKEKNKVYQSKLCKKLFQDLKNEFGDIVLNGPGIGSPFRLSNNLSVQFPGIDAEMFAIYLDKEGIEVGLGSACTTSSDEISHVLQAIGLSTDQVKNTLRFTVSKKTTLADIYYAQKYVVSIYRKLRKNMYE